jgi:stage II sporulation protein D
MVGEGGMTMKSIWREMIMAVIMGMILPGILLNWPAELHPAGETQSPENTEAPEAQQETGTLQMKLRRGDGSVQIMSMEDYLIGVILAELPSTFEQEAKKAQAVAARTYARKAWVTGGKHGDGSVCENPGCCQAHIFPEDYLAQGGSEAAVADARGAVAETAGLVLTYEGNLIEATYFSCSGGSTEDAVAVWGTDFPYLRAVESPGEDHAVHDTDMVFFSSGDFASRLGLALTGHPENWLGTATYTSGGGIHTLVIGGKAFSGTELRSKLGLYSTAFTMEADEQGVWVTTRGFGHRVGMSQYGADAMAMGGSTFREILAHYYGGTTLELTNDRR